MGKTGFFGVLLKAIIRQPLKIITFTVIGAIAGLIFASMLPVKYQFSTSIYIAKWEKHRSYRVGDVVMVEEPGYAFYFAWSVKAVIDELIHNIVPEVLLKRKDAGEDVDKKYVVVDRPKGLSFIKLLSRGTLEEKGKIATIHKEISEKARDVFEPVVEGNKKTAMKKRDLIKEKTDLIKQEIASLERQAELIAEDKKQSGTLGKLYRERIAEKIAEKKIRLADVRITLNEINYTLESFVDTHFAPIARSINPVSPNRPLLITLGGIIGLLLALHLIAFKVIRERL